MTAIAITPKRVHITRNADKSWKAKTRTYTNVSQYSRNRVYAYAKANAVRAVVNQHGTTRYYVT